MRFLLALLLLATLIYGGWPYYTYYRLDGALAARDDREMGELIDLESLRRDTEASTERRLQRQLPGQDPVSALVRDGARIVTRTAAQDVTLEWVRATLRGAEVKPDQPYPSLVGRTSFAFFESPTRFVARVGELGDANMAVRMDFREWQWRVTGLYPCNGW
jgi:hypothetical protein